MPKRSDQIEEVFKALADPTRRQVVERLTTGPATTSALAEPFDMALPSFMGHLKKLEEGGLIETTKSGRIRTCALKPEALMPARDWIEEQREIWQARLDRLDDYVTKLMKDRAHETGPEN